MSKKFVVVESRIVLGDVCRLTACSRVRMVEGSMRILCENFRLAGMAFMNRFVAIGGPGSGGGNGTVGIYAANNGSLLFMLPPQANPKSFGNAMALSTTTILPAVADNQFHGVVGRITVYDFSCAAGSYFDMVSRSCLP